MSVLLFACAAFFGGLWLGAWLSRQAGEAPIDVLYLCAFGAAIFFAAGLVSA